MDHKKNKANGSITSDGQGKLDTTSVSQKAVDLLYTKPFSAPKNQSSVLGRHFEEFSDSIILSTVNLTTCMLES